MKPLTGVTLVIVGAAAALTREASGESVVLTTTVNNTHGMSRANCRDNFHVLDIVFCMSHRAARLRFPICVPSPVSIRL